MDEWWFGLKLHYVKLVYCKKAESHVVIVLFSGRMQPTQLPYNPLTVCQPRPVRWACRRLYFGTIARIYPVIMSSTLIPNSLSFFRYSHFDSICWILKIYVHSIQQFLQLTGINTAVIFMFKKYSSILMKQI